MTPKQWFESLPVDLRGIVQEPQCAHKQAQLSRDPTGNMNLKITPEIQDMVKRFGIAAGASLIPNGIVNAMRGENLMHNALPVAAVSGGAYAAWPQIQGKLKGLQNK